MRKYSVAGKVSLKKSVIEESFKSPRGAAQILGSGESTTKKSVIEESSRALRRYSEAEKVPLKKEASSKSPTRVLEALR